MRVAIASIDLPVWMRICPLSWPLFENATSQCGHLNFLGRCFLAVIIFTCASSANTRAYSCSMTKGSTPMNGKFGRTKSWNGVAACGGGGGGGAGCGKNGAAGNSPAICCSVGGIWLVVNLTDGTEVSNSDDSCPLTSLALLLLLLPVFWPQFCSDRSFSSLVFLSLQSTIMWSICFELFVELEFCCDCIVVDVIVLSWCVFPSHGRNKREYVCGGETAHFTGLFIIGEFAKHTNRLILIDWAQYHTKFTKLNFLFASLLDLKYKFRSSKYK